MVSVKICGITNIGDAKVAENAGADALGFVFYKKSSRYIAPKKAKKIIRALLPFISIVGVFVNEKRSNVKKIAKFCNLDVLQFHGDESPEYCAKFKQYKTIKAFRIKNKADLRRIKRYNTDAILLDTFLENRFGGTGRIFDWRILKKLRLKKPVILSGGLNARNVCNAIKSASLYAVDVSSGVEKSFGRKNRRLMKKFIDAVLK